MTSSLFADYGSISASSGGLRAAAAALSDTWMPWSAGLGSVSVQAALDGVTAIHSARVSAAESMLQRAAFGVEQAVADMIAADESFVRALP
ncbi:hypothetical protein G3N18_03455 [Microbacterium sp. 2C]|uniref:hypothetical protein n=1 Tax=Microbacterium paulum TaxID=2707006 RepID=UPI0018C1ED41|nr:hypothetical protein [Microbacterium paulum]MBG0717144.1 hypothetical protein [Microbacterium paulum]